METETFATQLASKLKEKKDSPLYQKAALLFKSIDENLPANSHNNNNNNNNNNYKTSFFAALISFFKANAHASNFADIESQLLLVNWSIPHMPKPVISTLAPQINDLLTIVFQHVPGNYLAVTYGLSIVGQLLAMSPANSLCTPAATQQFQQLLHFSLSEKKPVRKTSCRVLKQFIEQRSLDVFASGNHFRTSLVAYFQLNLSETNESCQHSISLLGVLFKFFPFPMLADTVHLLLNHMALTDQSTFPYIFLCLEAILLERTVSEDLLEKIILQMLQLQLDQENIKLCHSYIQCLRQCIITLNELDQTAANAALFIPAIISLMTEFLLSQSRQLSKLATIEVTKVLDSVGEKVLRYKPSDCGILADLLHLSIDPTNPLDSAAFHQKYLAIIAHLLSRRFEPAQNLVLDVFTAFLGSLREDTFHEARVLVWDFIEQRDRFPRRPFEKAVGRLVQSVSLAQIFDLLPVNLLITAPMDLRFEDLSNVWILQIIDDFGKDVPLSAFLDHIMPLLLIAVQKYQVSKNQPEARVYFSVTTRLFGVCSKCIIGQIGNPEQFKARLIEFIHFVQKLIDDTDLQATVIKATPKLFALLSRSSLTSKLMHDFAQPFIQLLARKMGVNDTNCWNLLRVFSMHASQDYLQKAIFKNFDKILANAAAGSGDANFQQSLRNMDVILAVIGALDFTVEIWGRCIDVASTLLPAQNVFQKKAYKFLAIVLPKAHYTFLADVQELLLRNSKTVMASSRAKRLKVVHQLFSELFSTVENEESRSTVYDFQLFVQNFLPELISSVSDQNQKTRLALRALLQSVGAKLHDIQQLDAFISMVLAGLAGESSLMKANAIATIGMLTELFFQQLPKEFTKELTAIVVLMAKDQNNEVYKAVLLFFKSLLKSLRKHALSDLDSLPAILSELFASEQRKKNKVALRKLVQKLIQQFGLQKVQHALPEQHSKLTSKIIKLKHLSENRKNRLKKQKLLEKRRTIKKTKEKEFDSDNEQNQRPQKQKNEMEQENEPQNQDDNLLLKYDFNKQKFHFTQNAAIAKPKAKEALPQQEIEFKNGKIVINETKNITGKKRRREVQEEDTEPNQMQIEQQQNTQTKIKSNSFYVDPIIRNQKCYTYHQGIRPSLQAQRQQDWRRSSPSRSTVAIRIYPTESKGRTKINMHLFLQVLNKRFRAQSKKAFDQILSKNPLKGIKVNK